MLIIIYFIKNQSKLYIKGNVIINSLNKSLKLLKPNIATKLDIFIIKIKLRLFYYICGNKKLYFVEKKLKHFNFLGKF